jgi:[ribosomal protein S18]-alanine N-acetyltransferase
MIYRELDPSEAGFLKEMLYVSLFVPGEKVPCPRSVLERPELSKYYLKRGSIPHDFAVVAETDGLLVGAVWGRAHLPPHAGYGFVGIDIPEIGMAVNAEFRNQGVGAGLMRRITKHYQEQGLQSISLNVDKRNPANHLYDRLNFQVVKENTHAFIMQKLLNP